MVCTPQTAEGVRQRASRIYTGNMCMLVCYEKFDLFCLLSVGIVLPKPAGVGVLVRVWFSMSPCSL